MIKTKEIDYCCDWCNLRFRAIRKEDKPICPKCNSCLYVCSGSAYEDKKLFNLMPWFEVTFLDDELKGCPK